MIGQAYNPTQCAFLSNQAFNSNLLVSPSAPDTANSTTHIVVWNFTENKIQWVDTKTNIIQHELSGGGTSYEYATFSIVASATFRGTYDITVSSNGSDPITTYGVPLSGSGTLTIRIPTVKQLGLCYVSAIGPGGDFPFRIPPNSDGRGSLNQNTCKYSDPDGSSIDFDNCIRLGYLEGDIQQFTGWQGKVVNITPTYFDIQLSSYGANTLVIAASMDNLTS